MTRHPVKSSRDVPARTSSEPAPVREKSRLPAVAEEASRGIFSSFHYSYSEISFASGRAHVRAKRTALENGKMTSEAFEGDVDPSRYGEVVAAAQRHFAAQASLLFRAMEPFLGFRRNRERD